MTTTIGRVDINEKDLPKICGAIIQLEEHSETFATMADVTAAVSAGGGGGGAGGSPGGRLTLQTLTPVMTTTQSGKTTIYYSPYNGSTVPIYSGTSFTGTAFSELSVATTDTTKSPAAIGASKVNDWFVWSDSGTLRLGHGPDWTSDTARSAGTALVMVNGILLNNASITNGPAASRGTYVGTTRSNASSGLDWIYAAVSTGGTAGVFGVWNAYNRARIGSQVGDNTSSYSYTTASYRQVRASAGNQIGVVLGLATDIVAVRATHYAAASGGSINPVTGIGVDSTTSNSAALVAPGLATSGFTAMLHAEYIGSPGLGYHTYVWLELGSAGNTFFGNGFLGQTGMSVEWWA